MVVLDSVYLQIYFHCSLLILFRFKILTNYVAATEITWLQWIFWNIGIQSFKYS